MWLVVEENNAFFRPGFDRLDAVTPSVMYTRHQELLWLISDRHDLTRFESIATTDCYR